LMNGISFRQPSCACLSLEVCTDLTQSGYAIASQAGRTCAKLASLLPRRHWPMGRPGCAAT
jgi:hypothetical protein